MDAKTLDYEFLRPLVSAWTAKIERAKEGRSRWHEVASECLMFYSNSAQAMWDPEYSKKFWKNVKLPRFRITINKSFELVAIFAPNLMWESPHRAVNSKKALFLPPEFFGQDEQGMMAYQQFQQAQQSEQSRDKVIAQLMSGWLNYTPREMPGGGLEGHSERCTIDALIKGRGCLTTRNYTMPGSGRVLTGSFYTDPFNVFTDPDFNQLDECRWMAIKHTQPHYEVEEKFKLKKDSLKNKSTLESSWSHSEWSTDSESDSRRKAGQTGDNIVWYEIFSKAGCGARQTAMDEKIKDHMENVIGRHAYLAICPDVQWPLNMPSEEMRKGATDDDVRNAFSWPVPFWADDRWPTEFLDFYHDPQSSWPIAPLAPGLGELKLLNFLVSWLANRVWTSSRDFWAVAAPHIEHYKDYLLNGEDQQIIPTPFGVDDVSKAISVLQQPETRQDMTKLISFVSDMFDKRVGLTQFVYGLNQDGTQNRTAEETVAKSRAVSARPEFMQKQVVKWQGRVAQSEAFVTRWFVTGKDVAPLFGDYGSQIWDQLIVNTDVELVTRQFEYTIEASSIRRPNRERDIANFQQMAGIFLPVVQGYGQASGNYEPFNALMRKWGEYHDADIEGAEIPPPPEPDPAQAEMQQRMQQAEVAKVEAEAQKLMAEAGASAADGQMEQMQMQADMQIEAQKAQMEMEAKAMLAQQDMQTKAMMADQDMQVGQAKTLSEIVQDQARHEQDMRQAEEMHRAKLKQAQQMPKAKPAK
jgi:hypothetical protein